MRIWRGQGVDWLSLDFFSQDPHSQLIEAFCRARLGWGLRSGVSQAVDPLRVFCTDVLSSLQVLLDDESSVPEDPLVQPFWAS